MIFDDNFRRYELIYNEKMGKMNPLMEENGLMEFKVGGPPLLDKMDIMESLAPLNM